MQRLKNKEILYILGNKKRMNKRSQAGLSILLVALVVLAGFVIAVDFGINNSAEGTSGNTGVDDAEEVINNSDFSINNSVEEIEGNLELNLGNESSEIAEDSAGDITGGVVEEIADELAEEVQQEEKSIAEKVIDKVQEIADDKIFGKFDTELTQCGTLDSADMTYVLANDVYWNGTCFNITANGVTLDCIGHTINYSSDGSVGFGINSSLVNYTTIKNCRIVEGSATTNNKYAVYFYKASNGTVKNTTIITSGTNSYGVYLFTKSNNNNIENNTLNVSGTTANGIYVLTTSYNNTIKNNVLNVTGTGNGVFLYTTANDNNVSNNVIFTKGGHGVYMRSNYRNNIENNNITIYGDSTDGIFIYTSTNNNVVNNSILSTVSGRNGVYMYFSSKGNSFVNNTITTTGSSAHGFYIRTTNENNVFYGNSITTSSTGYGIYFLTDSKNNSFSNMNIKTNHASAYGVYVSDTSHNFTFTDSNISAGSSDFYANTGTSGEWNFTNVTFADSGFHADSVGKLNVHWYLDEYVNDSAGNGLDSVVITGYNNSDALVFSDTTNSSGSLARQTLLGYWQNSSGSGNQNNYTLYFVYEGDSIGNQQVNMTGNQFSVFTPLLTTLTQCGSLDTENGIYYLGNNVTWNGTCFNITANSVTLNCKGYEINYSATGTLGYGIWSNATNTTIRNCRIVEGSATTNNKCAVYFYKASNGTIENNTINTTGSSGLGIRLESSSNSNTITSNTISTAGGYGHGVYLYSSSNSNITSNTISTTGNDGSGILLQISSNSNITSNTISTTGGSGFGIYLSSSSNSNITSNNISTNSMGFYLYGTGTTHFNNIIDNNNYVNNKQINVTYNANNVIYDGVDLTQYGQVIVQSSGNVTISNSNISDNGITYANSNGTISNNNITSAKGTGVYLVYSPNSNITSNTISTAGGYGHGVYLSSSSNSNILTNNTISTTGNDGSGILLQTSSNSNITSNTISTTGNSGYGIYLYTSSNSNITSNTISTTNSYGYGIHLYISSNSNILTNNTISTAGGSGFGIYLSSSSNSNITSNTISTTNSYGYGIYLRSNSNSNTFDNNIVNTSHITDGWGLLLISNTINNTFSRMNITSNSPAVYVYDTGQNFTMSDSVLHSFSSYDFYAAASTTGNVNFTNVSFVNKSFVASSKGILNVHWYLDVYANYTNSTNAVGANITVWNVTGADGGFVNSSIIGDDGTIGRQILQEYSINTTGIISYFNNYTINASSVSGYEVISRSVNMSTNKYEIFEFDVSPANGSVTYPNESTYVNNTDVNFTINLTDNQGLANATLYIYNNTGSLIDTITTVLDSVTEKVLGVVKTLVGGIYIFFWKIVDVANNQFITSNVTFVVDYEYPQFVFNSPSPANGTGVSGEFMINLSLTETNLGNITYNWNGTNYSFFADSLDLMLNFDNSSLLGENDSYVVDFSSRKGNGSVIGAVWNSSGKYGGGFEFNGVNNSINVNQNLQCPEGMVYINKLNGFCIDKYEASPYNADDSENNSWTYYNSTTFTNNLLADGGKAGSVFNKTVWVYVNQSHARIACENAGKHLCTDEEWLAAANLAGNYYNLPVTLSASSGYGCVVDSNSYCALNSPGAGYACQTGVNKTGSITKCVSAEGVYDMTGNIWEWTNETVGYTNPCPGGATSCYWNGTIFTTSGAAGTATYGNDATYFSAGTNTGKAVLRGGVWDIGGSAGPFCASLGTGPAFPSSAVGFRCCSVQD